MKLQKEKELLFLEISPPKYVHVCFRKETTTPIPVVSNFASRVFTEVHSDHLKNRRVKFNYKQNKFRSAKLQDVAWRLDFKYWQISRVSLCALLLCSVTLKSDPNNLSQSICLLQSWEAAPVGVCLRALEPLGQEASESETFRRREWRVWYAF